MSLKLALPLFLIVALLGGAVGAGGALVLEDEKGDPRGGPPSSADIDALDARIAVLEHRLSRLERRTRGERLENRRRGARASSRRERAVVWAVGDGANGGAAAKALARYIASARPDRFLYLGDVYEHGTRAEFSRNYRSVYGRLDRLTAPTPGNHDWPNASEGYLPYWQTTLRRTVRSYYSLRAGGWQLLSLNSEAPLGTDSRQLRWLRRAVAGPGNCRLAFWHRPRFSAGSHGDQSDTEPLWGALRGKAKIVVGGHDHNMQRLGPIDGITQFVSGAGGKGHYELDRSYPRLDFANDRDYGALRLELRPGRARYAFVTATGKMLDSGAVRCRG